MTDKIIEARRAGFEAYVKMINPEDYANHGEKLFEWNGASYVWTWVNWDWLLWNAALDSVCVELPESCSMSISELDEGYYAGHLKSEIVTAIHAAGVRTK